MLTWKDGLATALAALVALVYAANTTELGFLTSNRWAAGAILVLGMGMCSLGRAATERTSGVAALSALGVAALALFVAALWTDAQWALALLALDTLVLFAGSTVRHAFEHPTQRPHAV